MRRPLALLLLATAGAVFAVRAGNVPAAPRELLHVFAPRHAARADCPVPDGLRPAFRHAAARSHLPVSLLVAMARVESNLRPRARSAAGARGLLQLMPATARALAVDPDRDDENVGGGARYMRQQLDRFGTVDLALAAYNAGPTAVATAGGAPSGETLRYIARVRQDWATLAGCR